MRHDQRRRTISNLQEEVTSQIPRLPFLDPIPSLEDQAKAGGFSAGIFDWAYAQRPNVHYFNSSIVQRPDGTWLIARRSRNDPTLRVGKNDIVRIELDGLTPKRIVPIRMPWQFVDEHFEDPRAIYHSGTTWISACDFVWGRAATRWTGSHQVIASFDEQWNCTGRFDIPYGGNGSGPGMNSVHNKNWNLFFHDGRPHIVYIPDPHTVLELSSPVWALAPIEHITKPEHSWKFGEIRGGAPPVLVRDEYWSFFHSSIPATLNNRNTRRYVMGAYAFEANPPFAMTRISRQPILKGSYRNRWSPDKPAVCFPCGSLLKNGEWLVVGGSNDLDTFWCKISHKLVAIGTTKVTHSHSASVPSPAPPPPHA